MASGIRAPELTTRHVLIVDAAWPDPTRDSASVRLLNLMRMLREQGWQPVLVSDDGVGTPAHSLDAGAEVAVFSSRRALLDWWAAGGAGLRVVVLCRHTVAAAWLPIARALSPAARVVFDTVDLHAVREDREARITGNRRLAALAKRTRAHELALVQAADVTWVVSQEEFAQLKHDVPSAELHVISNVVEPGPPGLPFSRRAGFLFVGGFRHPPNVDAVLWCAETIWPLIRAALRDATWHVVGAALPHAVGERLKAHPGIRIHGQIDDLSPLLAGTRVSLAPLRFGAGVKGKINQAWAHGLPVVATACAVEGMHATRGVHAAIADDPAAFAACAIALHQDEAAWTAMATAGRELSQRRYSPQAAAAVVRQSLPPNGSTPS